MKNVASSLCVYCNINQVSDSEHVVSKGLGGESIFMDCVCNACNNNFSKYERELLQKSFVGLLRSVAGLEGNNNPNKSRLAPLKGSDIFFFDEDEKILYEMGQHHKFNVYVRPQIIEIKNELYIELPSTMDFDVFKILLTSWLEAGRLIVELPKSGAAYKAFKFNKQGDGYTTEVTTVKNTVNVIVLDYMSIEDRFFSILTPRIYLDDDNRLMCRATSREQIVSFIKKLLVCLDEQKTFRSYAESFPEQTTIDVQTSCDYNLVERALIKIGLNCLMYYYPQTKYDTLLAQAKNFVLRNETFPHRFMDEANTWIDKVAGTHCILFVQQSGGLLIRMNLFEGQFIYSFYLPELIVQPAPSTSGVNINYVNRTQKFLNVNELIVSRRPDLINVK